MKILRCLVFPLLAAFFFGTSVTVGRFSTVYLSAAAINALRGLIAAPLLFMACRLLPGHSFSGGAGLWRGGALCGLCIFAAEYLLTLALRSTMAGKASFLLAQYVVLAPVLGLFLGRRVPAKHWIAVALILAGLYFLCMNEGFSLARADLLLLGAALALAVQVWLVDRYVRVADAVALVCVQDLVLGVLSALLLIPEGLPEAENLRICLPALLYSAVFATGGGYLLQNEAQRGGNPVLVTLLMSLESVFALLSAALLLDEHMSARELFGCALMLTAVLLAELPASLFHKRRGAPVPASEKEARP